MVILRCWKSLGWTGLCCLASKWCMTLFVTPWTIACQTPLSMGFPKQEYWRRLPFPSPGDLPEPGTKSMSPVLVGRFFTTELPGKPRTDSTVTQKCTNESGVFISISHGYVTCCKKKCYHEEIRNSQWVIWSNLTFILQFDMSLW